MDDSALAGKSVLTEINELNASCLDKFAPKMFGVCMRYANSSDMAEDILQDGFVKIFTKLSYYKGEGSLEGWIRRIVVNTALDQIRKNAKFKDNVVLENVDYKLELKGNVLEDLAAEDLMVMINEMPAGYKVVFNMFAIEGYSHKEIGEKLNVSENTSKSQYSRARSFLKKKLEEIEFER